MVFEDVFQRIADGERTRLFPKGSKAPAASHEKEEPEADPRSDVEPGSELETDDCQTSDDEGAWDSDSFKPQLNKMVTRLQKQLAENPMPMPEDDSGSEEADSDGSEKNGSNHSGDDAASRTETDIDEDYDTSH